MRQVASEGVRPEKVSISEPVLMILLSLAEGPRHGYSLLKDIETISSGRVRMSTGTLYGALHRLLEDGWIEPFQGADTSRDKRWYRLTARGRRMLGLEFERLQQLTRIARLRLRVREA